MNPDTVAPVISEAQRQILVAAAGGSLLSLLFYGEKVTWRTASATLASGLFAGYYGVELVASAFNLGPGYFGALGAAFGFGAMLVLAGCFKLLRQWRDDPGGFLRSFVPFFRKGGGE